METAAWLAIAIVAVLIFGMLATVVRPIRKVREERTRSRAIDELHRTH